jgi:hypothetical protein
MLPLFCLRLSLGLLAALLVLPPALIHPRFYRTLLLTVGSLCALALVLMWSPEVEVVRVGVALSLALVGAVVWSVEGAPGGRLLVLMTMVPLAIELFVPAKLSWRFAKEWQFGSWPDDLTSAGLLGFALSAMLLGHSYLINPSMSLAPLKRLLIGLGLCLLARGVVAGVSLSLWLSAQTHLSLANVAVMWLPLRWALGLLLPAVLTFMAWRTTLLRNTQSSTGILYVVVVFVCLGELTAQLLFNTTGFYL